MLKNNFFLLCIFFLSTATLFASSKSDSKSNLKLLTNSTSTVDAKKSLQRQPSNHGRPIFFPPSTTRNDSTEERRPAQRFKNPCYIPPISRTFFIRNETMETAQIQLMTTSFNKIITLAPNERLTLELSLIPDALASTIYKGQREDHIVYKRGGDVTISIQLTNVVHFEQAKINRDEILREITALREARIAALLTNRLARKNPQR
jgi:hypothetical protein